ncbi:hypothetical protein [Neobacillus massiliamazoniensis]|uniref:hypothetical protein n=1 Tax=Neobacillus massiliamazoniensis TaxID=1499688 RepID=UPI000B272085|nr:hypothetical protein [Neobacillus massiliamazoniensis]
MNISDKLTQQKLLEILVSSYIKGQENKNIQTIEILEDMKQKFLSIMNTNR